MKQLVKRAIMVILVYLVFTFICAMKPAKQPYCDPILQPYLDEWVDDCKHYNIRYKRLLSKIDSIVYRELPPGYWGLCEGDGTTIISNVISPDDYVLLRMVIYHELGHCALDYGHIDEYGINIMNSALDVNDVPLFNYLWDVLKEKYFLHYEQTKSGYRKDPCNKERVD